MAEFRAYQRNKATDHLAFPWDLETILLLLQWLVGPENDERVARIR